MDDKVELRLDDAISKAKALSDFIGMMVRVLFLIYISSIFGIASYLAYNTEDLRSLRIFSHSIVRIPWPFGISDQIFHATYLFLVASLLLFVAFAQIYLAGRVAIIFLSKFLIYLPERQRTMFRITIVMYVFLIIFFLIITFGAMGLSQGGDFLRRFNESSNF